MKSFSTEKRHANECFEINEKQMIKITKKGETVKFKKYTRKIKSLFMICTDFESTLVPVNNGKQNPDESCANRYQNHVNYSYGYKLYVSIINLANLLSHI